MIEVYIIRHAESEDNLRGVWAGRKDSPLSNHGMRQAEALAASLSHCAFTTIYTSDLKRAQTTARVVHSALREPVPMRIRATLREQNFGVAEGRKIVKKDTGLSLKAHYARGLFPTLYSRYDEFPGGENLEGVRIRAETFVEEMLTSLIDEGHQKNSIVGIVSHGIFIGELVAALLRKGGAGVEKDLKFLRGMKNTAWTKVEVSFVPVVTDPTQDNGLSNTHILAQGLDSSTAGPINLKIISKVVAVNRHLHLSNLHRQKGGIGSMAYDPKQQDIRKYLQVKPVRSGKKTVEAKGSK